MKKLVDSIRRVGLIANPDKAASASLVLRAARILASQKRVVAVDPDTGRLCGGKLPVAESMDEVIRNSDLLLVFGGDGTMLRVARAVAGQSVPILGINVGNLGFLTSLSPERLADSLRRILAGRFTLDRRALLEGLIQRGAESTVTVALNDFVLSRGASSRLIELEVSVNGEPLTRYRCDGLIASSPTGSTAYSLAAGGSIVSPDAEVLTLTPICPHTLSIRPVVISLQSVVRVRLLSTRLVALLAADGQQQLELSAGDTVTIRRSPKPVNLVRPDGASFFATLRQKFGWSGGKV